MQDYIRSLLEDLFYDYSDNSKTWDDYLNYLRENL